MRTKESSAERINWKTGTTGVKWSLWKETLNSQKNLVINFIHRKEFWFIRAVIIAHSLKWKWGKHWRALIATTTATLHWVKRSSVTNCSNLEQVNRIFYIVYRYFIRGFTKNTCSSTFNAFEPWSLSEIFSPNNLFCQARLGVNHLSFAVKRTQLLCMYFVDIIDKLFPSLAI